MSGKSKIITYEPDNYLKKGYLFLFKEIFNEIIRNHWLTYQFFKRDFLGTYRQSFMGIFWAILLPLISAGTFILLNRSGIFKIGNTNIPYPLFAIFSLSIWQLFSTGLILSSTSLVRAGSMIVKINFSKKSLVIASASQSFVSFFIQIIIVIILLIYYKITPDITILLLPLMILPVFLFTLGLGFILSLLNGIMRDIGNVISVIITFLMFITPVLYQKPETGILSVISKYNPLYYLISFPREIIFNGTTLSFKGFIISSLFSIAVFIICIATFHLTETRIAERI